MIVYVFKSLYGGYFNDYTTGYKLTYIKEREKTILLYYNDNLDDFISFVTDYYSKHGLSVEINRKIYSCDLIIEITNNRKDVLKTFTVWCLLEHMELKRNNRKLYHNELKKLFEVGDTK